MKKILKKKTNTVKAKKETKVSKTNENNANGKNEVPCSKIMKLLTDMLKQKVTSKSDIGVAKVIAENGGLTADGCDMSLLEISKIANLHKASANNSVHRLKKLGYIESDAEITEQNRRARRISNKYR